MVDGWTARDAEGDPARRDPSVSVVVPALNEARNLEFVLKRIPDDVLEVVLVDGWSKDETIAVARDVLPGVRVIRQTRKGKGNALACGFHACRGDIIVMLDADGSTDPQEIPLFVAALRAGAHFAKGTRFADGGGSIDITRVRRYGNWALNHLTNVLHGTSYTDLCYGYNAFWAECLPFLGVSEPGTELVFDDVTGTILSGGGVRGLWKDERWGDGFEIETVLAVRVSVLGLRVSEVASFESKRIHGLSNLNAMRDGVRVLRTIALERRRLAGEARPIALPRPWEAFRDASGARRRPWTVSSDDAVIDLRDSAMPAWHRERIPQAADSRAALETP